MSTCAVLGCSNTQTKLKESFSLPTTPEIKKVLLNVISRKEGNFSYKIIVCSYHIEEENVLTIHGDCKTFFFSRN